MVLVLFTASAGAESIGKPVISRLSANASVYANPAVGPVVANLSSGLKVRLFPESDDFQKIEWVDPDTKKTRSGFIKATKKRQSESKQPERESSFPFKKWGFLFGLSYSQLEWGQREVTVATEDVYEISAMTSATVNPALGAQYFLDQSQFLDFVFTLRSTAFTGTSKLQDSFIGRQDATLNHSMISITTGYGLVFKKYYYATAFAEWSKALSVTATINDDEDLPTDDLSLPLFIMVGASFGGWWNFASNYYFTPNIRAASIVNTSPGILALEVTLGVGARY